MLNPLMSVVSVLLVLVAADCMGGASSLDVSLGYGSQTFDEHKNKVNGDVVGLGIEYRYLDFLDIKLVTRQNETDFKILGLDQQEETTRLGLMHNGLSLALHQYTDFIPGNWTGTVQYHQIEGDLSDPLLGDVTLAGAGIRYETYKGNLFFDINYNQSDYTTGIKVEQWDFGAGVMFVPGKSWVQFRQYQIESNVPSRFNAYEILLKYWLSTEWILSVDDIFISYSFGERQLFFDPDAMVLWNNSDILQEYLRVGLSWELPYKSQLLLVAAQARYENPFEVFNYQSDMLYVELKKRF